MQSKREFILRSIRRSSNDNHKATRMSNAVVTGSSPKRIIEQTPSLKALYEFLNKGGKK